MIIPPIDLRIADEVASGRGTMHVCQTPASKVIVTDAARRGAHFFQSPADVSQTDRYRTTPCGGNTSIRSPRLNYPVLIGGGTTVSPHKTDRQDIISPKRAHPFCGS